MLGTSLRWPMAAVALSTLVALGGCDSLGGGGNKVDECPAIVKVNDGMGIHGELCETNADCEYGQCVTSTSITGGAVKFCTKKCRCGIGSECNDDPSIREGLEAKCVRMPTQATGEPLTGAFCVQECVSVSDCKLLDEAYNRCDFPQSIHGSVGARKVCLIVP